MAVARIWLVTLAALLAADHVRPAWGQAPPAGVPGAEVPATVARFFGRATVFTGDPAAGLTLEAFLGDGPATTLCGTAVVGAEGGYVIDVAAEAVYPSCGRAGDIVYFRLGQASNVALGARPSAFRSLPASPAALFRPGEATALDVRRAAPPGGPTMFTARTLVRLPVGCTGMVSTWPDGTDVVEIASSVRSVLVPDPVPPPLEAIWLLDETARTFLAWSPTPGAFIGVAQVNRLDFIFVCVRAPAYLLRPDPCPPTPYPGEIIVKFRPGVSEEERAAVHRAANAVPLDQIAELRLVRVRVPEGTTVEQALAVYIAHPAVESAGPHEATICLGGSATQRVAPLSTTVASDPRAPPPIVLPHT